MDFDAVEENLRTQADEYRARHLSVKLSLYAGFFAFEGLALAAAALVAQRAPLIATIVMGLTLISALVLFLQHHWLLQMFDVLEYTKISIRSREDLERHHAQTEAALVRFKGRRYWRRRMDYGLFVFAGMQILLLAFSGWNTS